MADWWRSWQDWFRLLSHVPVGWVNVALFLANPLLGVLFGAGFLSYEITQGSQPHKDIKGWLWGLGIGGAAWLIAIIVSGL